jgi:hypothetical protein
MARLSCLAAMMLMSLVAPTAIAQRLPLNIEDYLADNYTMMRDYGRCSVLYTRLAQGLELAEKKAHPAEAEEMWGRARDMKVAADTAFANVKAPADASTEEVRKVEAKIAAYTRLLESIIALETARQKALAERREIDIEHRNFCWRKRTQQLAIETLRKQGIFSSN